MSAALQVFALLTCVPLMGRVTPDAALAWAWAGIVAPALGALAWDAQRRAGGTWLASTLALAAAGLALVVAMPTVPNAPAALGAVAGCAALGWGLGLWAGAQAVALAVWLLICAVLLAALPSLAGILGPAPWSPASAARILSWSPATLVVEAAGLDWLRHPAVYDPVGGDSLGPDLYRPWGSLAGAIPAVVGIAAAALGRAFSPLRIATQE